MRATQLASVLTARLMAVQSAIDALETIERLTPSEAEPDTVRDAPTFTPKQRAHRLASRRKSIFSAVKPSLTGPPTADLMRLAGFSMNDQPED